MYNPFLSLEKIPTFVVSSPDIINGKISDKKFMAPHSDISTAENISPELHWQSAPAETKSFVVSLFDPDAPTVFGFWHWAVANIPSTTTFLPQDAGNPDNSKLPNGAIQLPNDLQSKSYLGVFPPIGQLPHHYFFTVWALDIAKIDFSENATLAALNCNMFGHVLARGALYFEVDCSILAKK